MGYLSWDDNYSQFILGLSMTDYHDTFSARPITTTAHGSSRGRGTSEAGSSIRTGSAGSTSVPDARALTGAEIDARFLPDNQCPTIDEMTAAANFLAKMLSIDGMSIVADYIDPTPLAHANRHITAFRIVDSVDYDPVAHDDRDSNHQWIPGDYHMRAGGLGHTFM